MMHPSFFLALLGDILLIPAQAEEAPTLKNRGSLLSHRTPFSGLLINFAAVHGTCDAGSVRCNDHCMPFGSNCCPVNGYCAADAYCAGDGCCPLGKVCSGPPTMCGDKEEQCGSYCMPEGRVCCSNGGNCNEGAACTADGLCSDSKADGPNCDPGTAACGSRCMPADAVCCEGGNYCDAGQTCVEGGSCSGGDDNRTTSGTSKPTPTGFGNFVIETVVGAAPTTTSASAGAPRGVYVNHAALAVGLCAAVPLGI